MRPVELRLCLPDGSLERISLDGGRVGMAVLTKMLPLKQRYALPEDLRIYRPDGLPLEMDVALRDQGLRQDDLLRVCELWSKVSPHVAAPAGGYASQEVDALGALQRAEALLESDDHQELLEAFNVALQAVDSKQEASLAARAYFGRARVQLRLKDWPAALRDAQRSLELQPDQLDPMCLEALALKELGLTEKARARLGLVLLKDPRHKVAKSALASLRR